MDGMNLPSRAAPSKRRCLSQSLAVGAVALGALSAQASAPVISPEFSAGMSPPPYVRQIMPTVAAGNGMYLVVWTEVNNYDSGNPDIYAVRVRASDGVVLDANRIPVATSPNIEYQPAAAFDGTNFLVVWNQIGSHAPLVYGTRVRALDGAVLDTPSIISRVTAPTTGQPPQYNPAVAFDGTNYLVVWEGHYVVNGVSQFYGVHGSWVRPSDGQVLNGQSFTLSRTGGPPQLAYTDGRYLAAWPISSNSQTDIQGVRVDATSGSVLDATALPIATTQGNENHPALAGNGGEFLVTWSGFEGRIGANRIRGSDGARLNGAAGFIVTGSGLTPPSVVFDGRDYRVLWQDTRAGDRKLLTTRISAQGQVAGGELILSSVLWGTEGYKALAAAAPGHFLTAYAPGYALKLRRVEDVQQDEQPCGEGEPTMVINGGAELTLECRMGGTYSDAGAQAFDGCGNPLTVHAYNTGADASGPGPLMSYEGSYSVSYSAWDVTGRAVNAVRTVHVDDRTAPTLSLKGAARMTHTCGSQWQEPGYEAQDACYGDLAHTVQRTGEVNGWAVGTYTVTYSLTDSGGNSALPVTRTVDVVNCPW